MSLKEKVKNKEELEEIADYLSEEMEANLGGTGEPAVSRFIGSGRDSVHFFRGKEIGNYSNYDCNINTELMNSEIFFTYDTADFHPDSFSDVSLARDLQEHRFNLEPKNVKLPSNEIVKAESIPERTDFFNEELKEFTSKHHNTGVTISQRVDQRVIVTSEGGKFIQSIPFISIRFSYGDPPEETNRDIEAVCNNEEDVKNLTSLVQYMPDPTPDGRIRNSDSFFEAFSNLHAISQGLDYGDLQDAGLSLTHLHDVIMANGIPIHEIFHHQFEEPLEGIEAGREGTFAYGQNILNKDIAFTDNPKKEVSGYRTSGFTYFDPYGRERNEREHIKNGQVVGFLGGEYINMRNINKFLSYEGDETYDFVGNSSQPNEGLFPLPRTSCSCFHGNTEKDEEMFKDGTLVAVPCAGATIPEFKTYTVTAYEAYIIRGGEPKRILPLQISGEINRALSDMSLLERESFIPGTCGKSSPIDDSPELVPTSQFTNYQKWRKPAVYSMPIPQGEEYLKDKKRALNS